MIFEAVKKNGVFDIDKNMFQSWLKSAKDGTYLIEIKRKSSIRTFQQNKFFHVICREIAIYTGEDFHEIKHRLKDRYLPSKIVNGINGEKIKFTKKTSDLSKDEMISFIDDCLKFAYDFFGLIVSVKL